MIVQKITTNINIFICFEYWIFNKKKRATILLLMIRSHVETYLQMVLLYLQ